MPEKESFSVPVENTEYDTSLDGDLCVFVSGYFFRSRLP